MGSGQGRTRRAAAKTQTAPPRSQCKGVIEKWSDFVKGNRVGRKNVYSYYLGDAPSDSPFAKENHEKVVRELFSDAIDLGIVSLSPLYGLDSFEIEAVKNRYLRSTIPLYSKVEVSLKTRLPADSAGAHLTGDTEVVTVPIKSLFLAEMDDPCVPRFFEQMKIAIDYLLSPADQD